MVPVTMSEPQPSTSKTVSKSRPKVKTSTHPPVAKMVREAIKILDNRNGSSVQAIKKHIEGKYLVDMVKVNPIIKKHLKKAVETKILVQTKGIGATGSFKLAKLPKQAVTKQKHVTGSEEERKSSSKEKTSIKKSNQKKNSKTEMKETKKAIQKNTPKSEAKKTTEKKVSRASFTSTVDGRKSADVQTRRSSRSSIA